MSGGFKAWLTHLAGFTGDRETLRGAVSHNVCSTYYRTDGKQAKPARGAKMLDERLSIFRRRLLSWYDASRRDLPWRVPIGAPPEAMPDLYHVLLSETM